jgi:hypothetical protein
MLARDFSSVLCIVGDSRSGSTVLQGLFELHPRAAIVGELRRLELFLAQGRDCGCGQPVSSCERWGDIITRAKLRPHEVRTRPPEFRLLKRFEEAVAFSGATLRVPLMTRPFLYRGGKVADHASRLLAAAAARARASVVVDSSKDPGHAVYLLHQKKLPVHVVFMCREAPFGRKSPAPEFLPNSPPGTGSGPRDRCWPCGTRSARIAAPG